MARKEPIFTLLDTVGDGSGNEVASIRWTFSKAGQPIEIHFDEGEYFEVYLNDNFDNLVKHRFTIPGKMVTETE